MKTIDIIVPTYNEEENVIQMYGKVKEIMEGTLSRYNFTLTFIDNCSGDNTRALIEQIAVKDKRVRAIYNARNFGHIRSPYHALSTSDGDCAVLMAADFQDPPEKIIEFVEKWEEGYKVIYAVKKKSKENALMYFFRSAYYRTMKKISEVEQIEQFTGYGLYDKAFVKVLKELDDPYPYMRGLVAELGFCCCEVEFTQPKRERGKTKNNFYTLYDMAMLGITTYTKKIMRAAVLIAAFMGVLSFLGLITCAVLSILGYTVAPLYFIAAGLSLFLSVILFFVGLLAEYVMISNQRLLKRPLVIEQKRINFEENKDA